jgi:uncharacterized SAM-binding protein YcdF (DUF218 family)
MEHAQATTGNRRWNRRRILKGLLLFILVWGILAWVAARALIVNAELASADAIVVLSGSSAYVERTQKAAELYRQGRAPLLLLTNDHTRGGWSSAQQRNPYFVERATDELIKAGVPADRIRVVPGVASSTHDESVILKDYALAQGLRSVLVVTSAYHSRRALRSLRQSFAGTGMTVGLEPAPAGSMAFWWLRPEGWRAVGGEYVKLIYYWFRYG